MNSMFANLKRVDLLDYLILTYRPKPYLVKHEPSKRVIQKLIGEKGLYGEQIQASTTRSLNLMNRYNSEMRPSILYNLASNGYLTDKAAAFLSEKAIKSKNSNLAVALIKWNSDKIPHNDITALYQLISFRSGKEGVSAIASGILNSSYQTVINLVNSLPETLYNTKNTAKVHIFNLLEHEIIRSDTEISIELLSAIYELYQKLPIKGYYIANLEFIDNLKYTKKYFKELKILKKFLINERKAYQERMQTYDYGRKQRNISDFRVDGLSTEYASYELSPLIHWEHSCKPNNVSAFAKLLKLEIDVTTSHSNWALPFTYLDTFSEKEVLRIINQCSTRTSSKSEGYMPRSNAVQPEYAEVFAHSEHVRKIIAKNLLKIAPELYYEPLAYEDYIVEVKKNILELNLPLKSNENDLMYYLVNYIHDINDSIDLKHAYLVILLDKVENDQLAADILRTLSLSELEEILNSKVSNLGIKVQNLLTATLPANPLIRKENRGILVTIKLEKVPLVNWTGQAITGLVEHIEKNCTNASKLDTLLKTVDSWQGNFEDLMVYANNV